MFELNLTIHRSDNRREHRAHPSRPLAISALAGIMGIIHIATLLAGCVNLQMRAGRRPNPELLESQLVLGISTQSDVEKILGAPLGRGRALLPLAAERQVGDMWSYYYEEGTLEESRRIFLFVYFAGTRLDGYMWVSSLPPLKPTPSPPGSAMR